MYRLYEIQGKRHEVFVTKTTDGLSLWRNGKAVSVAWKDGGDGRYDVLIDGAAHRIWIASDDDRVFVHSEASGQMEVALIDPMDAITLGGPGAHSDVVSAPMPGTVISITVDAGDLVKAGQPVIVIESMKLEVTLGAPRDGTVKQVHFQQGESFSLKAPLVTFEPLSQSI